MTLYKPPEPPGEFSLPLTPERLKWQLDVIGWGRGEVAHRLDIDDRKVAAWVVGRSFCPNLVAVWLEKLAQKMLVDPVPPDWNEREPGRTAAKHGHYGRNSGRHEIREHPDDEEGEAQVMEDPPAFLRR